MTCSCSAPFSSCPWTSPSSWAGFWPGPSPSSLGCFWHSTAGRKCPSAWHPVFSKPVLWQLASCKGLCWRHQPPVHLSSGHSWCPKRPEVSQHQHHLGRTGSQQLPAEAPGVPSPRPGQLLHREWLKLGLLLALCPLACLPPAEQRQIKHKQNRKLRSDESHTIAMLQRPHRFE